MNLFERPEAVADRRNVLRQPFYRLDGVARFAQART